MIRVLQVLYTLNQSDGSANVIMNIYRHIDRKKLQFDFLYFNDVNDSFKDEIEELGGNVCCFNIAGVNNKLSIYRKLSSFFAKVIDQYIAVHVNFPLLGGLIFDIAHKNGINNLILHSHSTSYGTTTFSRIRNFFLYKYSRYKANKYVACSKDAANFLFGKEDYRNGKVLMLANSINCELYDYNELLREDIRIQYGVDGKYLLLHVGRFSREKNHIFLLKVFAMLVAKNINAELWLVGDGDNRSQIEAFIKTLGLEDRIKLLGVRKDVYKLLQAADVFVMPSLFEGLPVTLVEAQASGTPCVVSDNVPNDACIIPMLYSQLSLNDPIDMWCDKIEGFVSYKKKSTLSMMKNSGFDIQQTAKLIEVWYQNL